MVRPVLLLMAAALLAACSEEAATPAVTAAAADAAAAPPSPAPIATASAAASPGTAREVKISNDLYVLEFAYPAQVAAIPDLRSQLETALRKQKAKLIADATEQRDYAKQEGFEYRRFDYWESWQVVTDLPGWLSLSGDLGADTGGAHPNHWTRELLWDKAAGKQRAPHGLFVSRKAITAALRPEFCRLLDLERDHRREPGENEVGDDPDDPFDDCVDPFESAVLLGSSNKRTFDRIGVVISPYVAGPYVEGDYEITLPVTPEILALVKPEFRGSFSLGR